MDYSREILLCLAESERPLRFKALAERLGLAKATLSRRLEMLRDVKLVEPIPDKDNLCWEYSLTEVGRRVAQEVDTFRKRIQTVSPGLTTA